ncbi:hypothetical protein C0993_008399 [Termitomyces sp. T159_Od127]|nr:hypothetical protein C0993_008399 [Termitomyces sp. T159_Od127]
MSEACVLTPGHALSDPSLCPISTLDDDALQEIFVLLCCIDDAPAEMPVILARVSSHWRRIVLSRPKLWTMIKVSAWVVRVPISEKQKKNPRFLKIINRVKSFLLYSRSMPLDISITLLSGLPIDNDSQRQAVSDVRGVFRRHVRQLSHSLSAHLSRIRTLTISVDEHSSIHDLQVHFSPTPMLYLEYLDIDVFGHQSCIEHQSVGIPLRNRDNQPESNIMGNCPNLTFIHLKGLPLACHSFAPQSVTELALLSLPKCCCPTWTELRRILLANDATLDIFHIDFVPQMDVDWEPFTLSNITSLLLTFKKVNHLYSMVMTFKVPKLEYLSITDGKRCEGFPVSHDEPRRGRFFRVLSALIDHFPLSSLRHLVLSHIWFFPDPREGDAWILNSTKLDICALPFRFFSAMTSLEILSLVAPTTVPLDYFNYSPCDSESPSHPLPSLQGLHLSLFNKHVIRDFLHTRRSRDRIRVLETIRLVMPDEWMDDIYLDLQNGI